jgi:hypothetical protein
MGYPLTIDAHYDADKALGTIRARKVFSIRENPEDEEYPLVEEIVEIDGSNYRLWTRVV